MIVSQLDVVVVRLAAAAALAAVVAIGLNQLLPTITMQVCVTVAIAAAGLPVATHTPVWLEA